MWQEYQSPLLIGQVLVSMGNATQEQVDKAAALQSAAKALTAKNPDFKVPQLGQLLSGSVDGLLAEYAKQNNMTPQEAREKLQLRDTDGPKLNVDKQDVENAFKVQQELQKEQKEGTLPTDPQEIQKSEAAIRQRTRDFAETQEYPMHHAERSLQKEGAEKSEKTDGVERNPKALTKADGGPKTEIDGRLQLTMTPPDYKSTSGTAAEKPGFAGIDPENMIKHSATRVADAGEHHHDAERRVS
jgi:hypothetical protein